MRVLSGCLAVIVLITNALHASANEATATVHIAIPVPREAATELLGELKPVTLVLDEDGSVKHIRQAVEQKTENWSDERLDQTAAALYRDQFEPALRQKVAKFNELMNAASTADQVSAGLLAFRGLARSMSRHLDTTGLRVWGVFDSAAQGTGSQAWRWEASLNGTTQRHMHLSGALDEEISLDLTAHGLPGVSCDLQPTASGEVRLELQLDEPRIFDSKPRDAPTTVVRLRPAATLTASLSISHDAFFTLEGEGYQSQYRTLHYPAVLELELTAQPPESD